MLFGENMAQPVDLIANDIATLSNFTFLKKDYPVFFSLAYSAEQAFSNDANTTLIKLRQLSEMITKELAVHCGVSFDEQTSQLELLNRLDRKVNFNDTIRKIFHFLRQVGNKAVHEYFDHKESALNGLRFAHQLTIWFYRSMLLNSDKFSPAPFTSPDNFIKQWKSTHNSSFIEALKKETSQFVEQKKQFEIKIQTLKKQLESVGENSQQAQDVTATVQRMQKAGKRCELDEKQTRVLIDQQLRDAGWEADSVALDWRKGARPEKGKNLAIAEVTTVNGQRADYVLFMGLMPLAAVEAKKKNTDVAGKITQAERYAKGFQPDPTMKPAWTFAGESEPWSDNKVSFTLPFVYSCNGRRFIKQLKEKSGTWFRDVRAPSNLSQPLQSFHSPQGLLDKLQRSQQLAEEALKKEGFSYLKLRDYQEKAIVAVEKALEEEKKNSLLAMATGTGKTRTIIGLMYRFLKTERFKRILFLVDRRALGNQAQDSFDEAPLEQNISLSKAYNIARLGDMEAEAETRIQVATVQAMVKRVFMSDTAPSVDQYDCIIVDEAHRGYTLDQEMTEGELQNRDSAQYLSAYRRVLDYFDAVKIGLTATPAKHTVDIFGRPVYTYSYREAVAEGWLIDHEPPIRYETELSKHGIQFEKGQAVKVVNAAQGEIDTCTLEDELNFDVAAFNRKVITEGFNRVICNELAKELDPFGEEKTLIFCVTDAHADMVKRLLDEAFVAMHEDSYNQSAVAKITGQSDKVDDLIRQYKNEAYPNIAITVDLLSTGIDVPAICNIVFLRRVASRILYEQMLGRATRRCDDMGKTVFKIYDPVDIYSALESISTMKPLVKNPKITLTQLVEELTDDQHLQRAKVSPGETPDTTYAHDIINHLCQKIMRVTRTATQRAPENPALQEKLQTLKTLWQSEPLQLHEQLQKQLPEQVAAFLKSHSGFIEQIESLQALIGSDNRPVIYEGEDSLIKREQLSDNKQRPEDYLKSFSDFIHSHMNQSIALSVVVNRPKDLTREQLKEVRLLLDNAGFSEPKLKNAWRNQTSQEIAASIIGFIRQAAMGEALIPFEQRVSKAIDTVFSQQSWTPVQKKWLQRLAKQLTHETLLDKPFINQCFARDGGVKKVDKLLNNQLDNVLSTINDSLWKVG